MKKLNAQVAQNVAVKFIDPPKVERGKTVNFTLTLSGFYDAEGLDSIFVFRADPTKTFSGEKAGATFGTKLVPVSALVPFLPDSQTGNWYVQLKSEDGAIQVDSASNTNFEIVNITAQPA